METRKLTGTGLVLEAWPFTLRMGSGTEESMSLGVKSGTAVQGRSVCRVTKRPDGEVEAVVSLDNLAGKGIPLYVEHGGEMYSVSAGASGIEVVRVGG